MKDIDVSERNNTMLICPVCKNKLHMTENGLACDGNHCFDRAKEGYVNLLCGQKPGDARGDSKEMAKSRHEFLKSGAYSPLAEAVGDLLQSHCPAGGTVLDICCGEGDYTDRLTKRFPDRRFYGFDISKEMVRLAAKRRCGAEFFVANLSAIPLADSSVDFAFHLFAPFHEKEFSRVLKKDGRLVTVIPGSRHLFGLKEILYEHPYENDEAIPELGGFTVEDKLRVRSELVLTEQGQMTALLQMTPYYFRTPAAGMEKLQQTERLVSEIEFVLYLLKK